MIYSRKAALLPSFKFNDKAMAVYNILCRFEALKKMSYLNIGPNLGKQCRPSLLCCQNEFAGRNVWNRKSSDL
jgi:hypothetical protein